MVSHHLTWRRHSHVSPTYRTNAGSGPPPLNSLTFRPVVGQLSEVVPLLFLEPAERCYCRRRCRCSTTGGRHTFSQAATKLFDFKDISFSYSLSPLLRPCNSFYCLGLFKNVYDDDDDDDDEGTSRRLVRAERRNSDGDDVGRFLVCVCVSGALRRLAQSAPTQLN